MYFQFSDSVFIAVLEMTKIRLSYVQCLFPSAGKYQSWLLYTACLNQGLCPVQNHRALNSYVEYPASGHWNLMDAV